MRFFDQRFKTNKARYIVQCLLATLSVFIILLLLDAKKNTVAVAALGASSFIVFTMPHRRNSNARFLIGGYIVGITSGFVCYHLSRLSCFTNVPILSDHLYAICGGLAVGLAIFFMVVADLEHPPAAAVSLAFALKEPEPKMIVLVFAGIISLVLIKRILRPLLIDLL